MTRCSNIYTATISLLYSSLSMINSKRFLLLLIEDMDEKIMSFMKVFLSVFPLMKFGIRGEESLHNAWFNSAQEGCQHH